MGRIFHQLTRFGKEVFPYTDIRAVLDSDGRNLKQLLKNINNRFDELDLQIRDGILVGPAGEKGEDGQNIELRKTETSLQWKLEDSEEWIDLISLNELIPNNKLVDDLGNVINVSDLADKEYVNNKILDSIDDNLFEGSSTRALSSNQGIILKNSIDNILDYIGKLSFDDDGNIEGIQGPKGEDGKNIELRSFSTIIQWKLEGSEEWKDLLNISDILPDNDLQIEDYLNSQKCIDLDEDPSTYLLTVAQGRTLKSLIDSLYNYISGLGLDTNVDCIGTPGPKGEDGKNPEFREYNGYLQWRLEGDSVWINLIKLSLNSNENISIIDNLYSEDSESALSANQGKILNDKILDLVKILNELSFNESNCEFDITIRNKDNILQWKSSNMEDWIDLIDLSNIKNENLNIIIEDSLSSYNLDTALSSNQGRVLNDKIISILNYLNHIGLDPSGNISGIQGPKGEDGKNIVLRNNDKYIQWKYENDEDWNNLISISELISIDSSSQLENYVTKDFLYENISDNLKDNSPNKSLSSRQGTILKNSIDSIYELISISNNDSNNSCNIEVIDDLESINKDKPLSANQGKILNDKLNNISDKIKSLINLNNKLIKSNYSPGKIVNGNLFIIENEWTCNYYEQVIPNKVYIFKSNCDCDKLRWNYYSIENNEIVFNSSEEIDNKTHVTIKIPDNIRFIKLGFNTKNPDVPFLNYEFYLY